MIDYYHKAYEAIERQDTLLEQAELERQVGTRISQPIVNRMLSGVGSVLITAGTRLQPAVPHEVENSGVIQASHQLAQ